MLSRLLGKKKEAAVEVPPCPHTAVVARWDRPEDMGKQDRVSSYSCTACGASLSAEEGRAIVGV
jgi:hypothetical protein